MRRACEGAGAAGGRKDLPQEPPERPSQPSGLRSRENYIPGFAPPPPTPRLWRFLTRAQQVLTRPSPQRKPGAKTLHLCPLLPTPLDPQVMVTVTEAGCQGPGAPACPVRLSLSACLCTECGSEEAKGRWLLHVLSAVSGLPLGPQRRRGHSPSRSLGAAVSRASLRGRHSDAARPALEALHHPILWASVSSSAEWGEGGSSGELE